MRSFKREMNSFPCCLYSTTQEQDQQQQSEQEQKEEEENLKLLDEIKIANPFKIYVGSSFIEICDKTYFNDRTEIIADAIKNKKMLIFHPPRSGKSTSLDTIATFLEKPLNKDGGIDEFQYKQAQALFFGGETSINGNENQRFDPLKIANIKIEGQSSQKWFGRYPSLRLNFSSLKNLSTIEAVERALIRTIKEKFDEHEYLLNNLNPSEQKEFNQIKNNQKSAFLYKMIEYLCSHLYDHHKEQVGVFIDECDNSFNSLLAQDNPDYDLLKKTSQLISSFLECLSKSVKKFPPVRYVIVVGVYDNRIKEVSGPNNFIEFSVARNTHPGYYGLSQEEVEKNVKFLLDPNQENYEKKLKLLLKRIQFLFNGYTASGKQYYNIWSVFNYLDSISFAYETNGNLSDVDFKFWSARISDAVIIRILRECKYPDLKCKLLRIGLGQSQNLFDEDNFDLITPIDELSERELEKYASSILLNGGFITRDILNQKNFVIPNEEVRVLFQSFIPEVVDSEDGKTSIRQSLAQAIRAHDKQKIQEVLELFCVNFFSCRKQQDFSYLEQGFSNALSGLLNDIPSYELLIEQPAREGFHDIILKPKDNHQEMIIIELKALSSKLKRTENNLKKLAKEGISQIKNRKYPAYALKHGMISEKWIMIGIAFDKKSVVVELEFFKLTNLKKNDTSKRTNTSS